MAAAATATVAATTAAGAAATAAGAASAAAGAAEEAEENPLAKAPAVGWRRIARHLLRIRRRQLLFAYLGQHLQTYPPSLREALVRSFPTARQLAQGTHKR